MIEGYITILSIYQYGFLPFSLTLLYAIENRNYGFLLLYHLVEQTFLFSLLNINQITTILLSLFVSISHLYLAFDSPYVLVSPTASPSFFSLILETFASVSILSIAVRISQSTKKASRRRDIDAWNSLIILHFCIRKVSQPWALVPILELLDPWSETSFATFYCLNLFLLVRLFLSGFLVQILVGHDVEGETQMILYPGLAIDLLTIGLFSEWHEVRMRKLESRFAKKARSHTFKMAKTCTGFMLLAPIGYIPWMLLKFFTAFLLYTCWEQMKRLVGSHAVQELWLLCRFFFWVAGGVLRGLLEGVVSLPMKILGYSSEACASLLEAMVKSP